MDIIDQINNHVYPNALAKLKVSLKDMSVEHVGLTGNGESEMAAKKSSKNATSNAEVDFIWKNLGLGKIDISYACVGYTLDGRPVLSHDEFVNLLVNYGFNIQAIMLFIDDFAKHAEKDDTSPIVMYSVNTARIMTEIKPIVRKK